MKNILENDQRETHIDCALNNYHASINGHLNRHTPISEIVGEFPVSADHLTRS